MLFVTRSFQRFSISYRFLLFPPQRTPLVSDGSKVHAVHETAAIILHDLETPPEEIYAMKCTFASLLGTDIGSVRTELIKKWVYDVEPLPEPQKKQAVKVVAIWLSLIHI